MPSNIAKRNAPSEIYKDHPTKVIRPFGTDKQKVRWVKEGRKGHTGVTVGIWRVVSISDLFPFRSESIFHCSTVG